MEPIKQEESIKVLVEIQKELREKRQKAQRKDRFKKLTLFIVTFICTTLAGSEWIIGKSIIFSEDYSWADFVKGMYFAIPFLGVLTIHEFGHYFAAKYHKVSVSLPNYIPGWLGFLGMPSIGTFGAVIRIREKIQSKTKYFDIGVAGPLAGFVAAVFLLFYGFTHLPDPSYIYQIHPEYEALGENYDEAYREEGNVNLSLGNNLLFSFFEQYVADPELLPNRYEIIHYPLLFAGFLALFFTALNLLPIGQLDGGHILYGLFGRRGHRYISMSVFFTLAFVSGVGLVSVYMPAGELLITAILLIGFYFISFKSLAFSKLNKLTIAVAIVGLQFLVNLFFPQFQGFQIYMVFVFLTGRILGVQHPSAKDERPLTFWRKVVGWLSLLVFILCFSHEPFVIEIIE